MLSFLKTWAMGTQQQWIDQLNSLVNSLQNSCRLCGDAHLDGECQKHTMLGIGYLDSQSDTFSPQQHHYQYYYPESFEVYPHSSYSVHEPQPYESSNLGDMPIAYLSSNATLSHSYNPLEQLLKEQDDMLRRCTDRLSKIETLVQVSSKGIRDQVTTDYRLQEDERHSHTTPTSHEPGCKNPTPTQSSKSSLPPIINLSTSETNEEFILEELSEPLLLETSGRGDEYDEVDEEIEMENPEMKIYTEDSASKGPEECTPTLSSDLIPIQTDVVDANPQLVVVDDIPHIFLDESPPDLVVPSIPLDQPVAQVVDENVATNLETSTDTVPPPCLEYNIFTNSKTIGSKVGSVSWLPYKPSLHNIMTYTSWSGKDTFDQPILPIQLTEVIKVERFVTPPVEQFPHFELSPHIGHTLALNCLKLLGMYQYYHLCLLMDARKPLGSPDI